MLKILDTILVKRKEKLKPTLSPFSENKLIIVKYRNSQRAKPGVVSGSDLYFSPLLCLIILS